MSLDRYLEQWAAEEGRAGAPAGTEAALRAALAERRRARRRRQWAGAAAAAAAGIALVAVAAGLSRGPRETAPPAGLPEVTVELRADAEPPVAEAAAPAAAPTVALPPMARPVRPVLRRPRPQAAGRPAVMPPEMVWQPVGAWQAVEPMERGMVVRVKLPRATLATLGMPVNAERVLEPIPAELLLGEDGTVRAVRMVSPVQ